jgi:PKD repeat protein
MKHAFVSRWVALAVVLAAAGCTMKEQEPPALAGPSEFSQSITVTVTPDVIQQDGASQSIITVTARGANGQPLANVPLRAEILVNGVPADFGALSARNVVTNSEGRASLVYTAPAALGDFSVDAFTIIEIGITPLGSNFGNSTRRLAALRLVPTGTVVPPDGLRPAFTFTPTTPTDNQAVLFDATSSASPANNPIARYDWDFGDGERGSGATATHQYRTPGTYTVTLTISDALGRARSTTQSITVGAGASPVAQFTMSPTAPRVGDTVNFNGILSTPAPGRRIVSYAWDFGDGTRGSGQRVTHVYGRVGTYVVVLTVTDDAGRTNSVSAELTILPGL